MLWLLVQLPQKQRLRAPLSPAGLYPFPASGPRVVLWSQQALEAEAQSLLEKGTLRPRGSASPLVTRCPSLRQVETQPGL